MQSWMRPRKMLHTSLLAPVGYTVRFKTSKLPKDPMAHINLYILNSDGFVFCHRYHPSTYSTKNQVIFQSYDIGQIESVLVSPETDTWDIEEVIIESPMEDLVLVKTYDSSHFVKQKEFNMDNYIMGMADYLVLKDSIIQYSLVYTLVGAIIVAAATHNVNDGLTFGVGGVGVLYQKSLHNEVDNIGKQDVRLIDIYTTVNGLVFRMMLFGLFVYAYHEHQQELDPYSGMLLALGFLTNKAALLHVALTNKTRI